MQHLKFWVQSILPVVYDDSLSYYEFLAKVCSKLNEVIDVDNKQNISIGELQEELDRLINGDVIREEVDEYLSQLLESGELDEIIRSVLKENANLNAITSGFYTYNNPAHAEYAYIIGMTAEDFYDKYEELGMETYMQLRSGNINMKAFIHYSNLSKRFDVTGNTNPELTLAVVGSQTSNYIFLTSGTHGNEKSSMWGLYLTVKEILTSNDTLSRFIRDNFNIVVIPCINPYGIDYMASHTSYSEGDDYKCRYNENGVDLNHNYDYNWVEGEHNGSSAFSEPETLFVKAVVESLAGTDKTQGMFCLDCHNFDPADYIRTGIDNIVYYATENGMDRNIMNRSINALCNWIAEYYPDEYARYNLYPSEGKRPVSCRNYGAGASLNNWMNHTKGYQHVFLFESPCAINGVFDNYANWYKQADLDIAYQTCKLMVCCTAFEIGCQPAKSVVYAPATYGRTQLGIQNSTIAQIVERMAFGSHYCGVLTNLASALSADMATNERGIFKIEKPASNDYIKSITYWYPADSSNIYYRIDTNNAIGVWRVYGHTNVTGDELSMMDFESLSAFVTELMRGKDSCVFVERFMNNFPSFNLPGEGIYKNVTIICGRNKFYGTQTDGISGVIFVQQGDIAGWMGRITGSGVGAWHQLYGQT